MCLFVHCNGQKNPAPAAAPAPFRMVRIPSLLTSPSDRAEYLVRHYWDLFDFSDTLQFHFPEITEQAFVDYIDLLPHVPLAVASQALGEMLARAEAEAGSCAYFADLFEKYLYDANSPFRNDEFYIPVLEHLVASPLTKEKLRYAHLLDLARRNRPGSKATDFAFLTAKGEASTLYAISTDYILLYFNNPDCNNCREVSLRLQSSPSIGRLLREKRLSILSVYPDEDLDLWRSHPGHLPSSWLNTCDTPPRIKDEELYDLKAIPTLYLLSGDKTVLLKDPSYETLENYVSRILP
jgi:hypothetical protein